MQTTAVAAQGNALGIHLSPHDSNATLHSTQVDGYSIMHSANVIISIQYSHSCFCHSCHWSHLVGRGLCLFWRQEPNVNLLLPRPVIMLCLHSSCLHEHGPGQACSPTRPWLTIMMACFFCPLCHASSLLSCEAKLCHIMHASSASHVCKKGSAEGATPVI